MGRLYATVEVTFNDIILYGASIRWYTNYYDIIYNNRIVNCSLLSKTISQINCKLFKQQQIYNYQIKQIWQTFRWIDQYTEYNNNNNNDKLPSTINYIYNYILSKKDHGINLATSDLSIKSLFAAFGNNLQNMQLLCLDSIGLYGALDEIDLSQIPRDLKVLLLSNNQLSGNVICKDF